MTTTSVKPEKQKQDAEAEPDAKQEEKEKPSVIVDPINEVVNNYIVMQSPGMTNRWLRGSEKVLPKFRATMIANGAKRRVAQGYAPSVQKLDILMTGNPTIRRLSNLMFTQNINVLMNVAMYGMGNITTKTEFLDSTNEVLANAPAFLDSALVGCPYSALWTGINTTNAGLTLFQLPEWNDAIGDVFNAWHTFLDSEDSNVGFRIDGQSWLSEDATNLWHPPDWKKDSETLPWYKSWNSWFTRDFLSPSKQRPICEDTANAVLVASPNDGGLFRWRDSIKSNDVFWFKHMPYSLADIFTSTVPAQQALFDKHRLASRFTNGVIFQTYLNQFDFHRWWSPIAGSVLFNPVVIPGFYFSKCAAASLPDIKGNTEDSLPYLCQVNARGLLVIDTGDDQIGYVCCVQIGMGEVSTVVYEKKMKAEYKVAKGEEMGYFQFGGSSWAIIFEDVAKYGKTIQFVNQSGDEFPQDPSDSDPFNVKVGSQIAKISAL